MRDEWFFKIGRVAGRKAKRAVKAA